MGVSGLWTLLQPVGRPVKLETMEGKRMAIDSSIWLYQFQATMRAKDGRALVNAHILGFLRRICKLLFYGIKPVFVFDGGAPVLKKMTITERKKKKSGAALSYAKTAEKILAAQMRREALNHIPKPTSAVKPTANKGKGKASDSTPLEGAVYLEDLLDDNVTEAPRPEPMTPATKGKGKAKASDASPSGSTPSSAKKQWHDHDPYQLPEIDMDAVVAKAANAHVPDPRLATDDELREFIDQMVPEDFDTNSEAFRELPTEVQYEIIGDLRLKSRQTSHMRLESMLNSAPTPLDFSKAQIKNLQQRNNLTQKLLNTTETVGKAGHHTTIPVRIASERNREYVLVKNHGADGGWVLGIRDDGTKSKPIVVDLDEEGGAEGSEESDDSMEEVLPPIQPTFDPDLREHHRTMTLAAIGNRPSSNGLAPLTTRTRNPVASSSKVPLFVDEDAEFEQDGDLIAIYEDEVDILADVDPELQHALQQSLDTQDAENLQKALDESRRDISPSPTFGEGSGSGTPSEVAGESDRQFRRGRTHSGSSGSTYVTLMSRVNGPAAKLAAVRNSITSPSHSPVASSSRNSTFTSPSNDIGNGMPKSPMLPDRQYANSPTNTNVFLRGQRPPIAARSSSASGRMLPPPSPSPLGAKTKFSEQPTSPSFVIQPKTGTKPALDFRSVPTPLLDSVAATGTAKTSPPNQREPGHITEPDLSMYADDEVLVPPMTVVDLEPSDSRHPSTPKVDRQPLTVPGVLSEDSDDDMEEVIATPVPVPATPVTPIPSLKPTTISTLSVAEHPSALPTLTGFSKKKALSPRPVNEQISWSGDVSSPRLDWSPTPSPPPVEIIDIDEEPDEPEPEPPQADWDAAQEMNAQEEEGDFANFMSQVKGQDIEKIRSEIDEELKVLNQQKKVAMRDSEDITQQMISQIQVMLRLFGIPYVTAPMEAEAQCATLVSLGLVEGIITDDSDVFLFGGLRVFRNMFNQSKTVECFLLADLSRELGLDRDTLVRLAYLLGSDYVDGLPGVGPVLAMEMLKEFPGENGLTKFKEWWQKVQSGKDKPEDNTSPFRKRFKKKFKDLHITDDWPPAVVRDAYYNPTVDHSDEPFKWGLPDLDALREFLNAELSWPALKVDETLLPIIRKVGQRGQVGSINKQNTLEGYFDTSIGAGTYAPRQRQAYASKRLQKVVADFRKEKKRAAGESSASRSPSPVPEEFDAEGVKASRLKPKRGGKEKEKETPKRTPAAKVKAAPNPKGKTAKGKRKVAEPSSEAKKSKPRKKRKVAESSEEDISDEKDGSDDDVREGVATAVPDRPLEVKLRPRPKPRFAKPPSPADDDGDTYT